MAAAIKQRINDANSILIVPKQEPDLDVLAASFSLARSLHKSGKKISMYIDPEVYTDVLKAKFPPQSISFMKKNDHGSIVISLDNVDAPVKEVKWKEEKGTVNIYVTTDGGKVPGDKIKINQSTTLVDLVVMVDAAAPDDLGDFYTSHKQQFSADRVAIFTPAGVSSPENITGYEIRTASFSQGMFEFMQREQMDLDDEIATTLLAGLYWKTNNFKNDMNDNSFTRASELQGMGADQELATNIANRTLSLHDVRYFSDIYSSVVSAGDGIFYTIVPERKAKEKELFTDHVPTASLIGCRAAFTVVHGSNSNVVYLKSNTREISLQEIVNKYEGKLNGHKAIIKSAQQAEALAQELVTMLKQSKPVDPVAPEQPNKPAPSKQERKEKPDKDFEKTKKWLDEMSKEAGSKNTPPPPKPVQQPKPEPKPVPAPEPKPAPKQPEQPKAPTPKPEPAPKPEPTFDFSPTPITPSMSGGDPLAPAAAEPEPLDLDGSKKKEQQQQSFAPNTPLPPASI